jgi:hypothetical protein
MNPLVIAAALAVQTFEDVSITWHTDGFCFVAVIENRLAPANYLSQWTIAEPIAAQITINHARPAGPETITIVAPGYTVDPPQLVLPDHGDNAEMLVCPEVGV